MTLLRNVRFSIIFSDGGNAVFSPNNSGAKMAPNICLLESQIGHRSCSRSYGSRVTVSIPFESSIVCSDWLQTKAMLTLYRIALLRYTASV